MWKPRVEDLVDETNSEEVDINVIKVTSDLYIKVTRNFFIVIILLPQANEVSNDIYERHIVKNYNVVFRDLLWRILVG